MPLLLLLLSLPLPVFDKYGKIGVHFLMMTQTLILADPRETLAEPNQPSRCPTGPKEKFHFVHWVSDQQGKLSRRIVLG